MAASKLTDKDVQITSVTHIAQAVEGISVCSSTYQPQEDGLFTRFTICGKGPLVVVQAPGWGVGYEYLVEGITNLEQYFTMLYVEARGSNNPVRPEEDQMTTSNMIDDLEKLRQYLNLPKLCLMGHSHGGIIALGYSQRYPDRVRRLELVVHALHGYDDSAEWEKFSSRRKGDPRYATAYAQRASAAMNSPPKTDDEYTEQFLQRLPYCFADPVAYKDVFAKTITNKLSLWTWNALAAADPLSPFSQLEDLPKVCAPTLVVAATEDPFGTVNVGKLTHEGIKGSDLEIIQDCGHFPWIEKPQEFFGMTVRFFS